MLHERHAPALVRQAFLLCGSPRLARRSVAHAFRLAWRRWPRVAVDPDPAGWVRAVAYRHALAPWRHFRLPGLLRRERAMRHVPPRDRPLLDALLRLPPAYRAALLLHDGLGLALDDTAAEVEAGTAAASGRIRHAREALAAQVPAPHDVRAHDVPAAREIAPWLRELAAPQPAVLPPPRRVRRSGEARAWCATAAALGLVTALFAAGFALCTPHEESDAPPPRAPAPGSAYRPGSAHRPGPRPDSVRPSATLAPDRRPGRPGSAPGSGPGSASRTPVLAVHPGPAARHGKTDGPAPGARRLGTGPFTVLVRAARA
ncbi:hypothetical protein HCC61_06570 [Streptomyces sp. HNM0575]|uniref:RNA polymerase sigma factor n=1 Tax=Streptomyces sp. HNM0575 TaxID=2716338 RepID=UPI00145EF036|nr:hypothetical protein [Streptomyces sp. HNM0575]NLU72346.1 hypothetical protein [Streptomyces sp. HNM0575]